MKNATTEQEVNICLMNNLGNPDILRHCDYCEPNIAFTLHFCTQLVISLKLVNNRYPDAQEQRKSHFIHFSLPFKVQFICNRSAQILSLQLDEFFSNVQAYVTTIPFQIIGYFLHLIWLPHGPFSQYFCSNVTTNLISISIE